MSPLTERLTPNATDLKHAADLLRQGALVSFPTETVYGLGADARQGEAVAGIYTAKGRPSFNPLIIHLADTAAAKNYVEWSDSAETLAQAFWPGPLTLVLPLRADHDLSPLVTAGLPTVAVRVPAHPTAQALLTYFAGPVAAPSANPSGRISPTTADHVIAGLEGRIAAVVDDGQCTVGLESTIIGFDNGTPVLLRAGGLPTEEIEAVLGQSLAHPQNTKITAPGQLTSHYAPRGAVRLNATAAHDGELMLGFGKVSGILTLSADGDLTEAAANLFGHLHQLDAMGGAIAVAPIPMQGLGCAINDRLNRAAAPRG
jgi:L-threonylcarbamoyladenylate synthase